MTSFQFAKKETKKKKKEIILTLHFHHIFSEWMNEWMFNDTAINALIPPPPPHTPSLQKIL